MVRDGLGLALQAAALGASGGANAQVRQWQR
jgi:hypothetical protein